MKRYLIFSGNMYYPLGGGEDFLESCDTMIQAVSIIDKLDAGADDCLWVNVLDTVDGDCVGYNNKKRFPSAGDRWYPIKLPKQI